MQYHADVLERSVFSHPKHGEPITDLRYSGLQHEHPRAPRFLVLGYQNACRDWESSRKRVVAYTVS